MKTAEKNSKVKVHYTGTFTDGEEFDSSRGRSPLEFTVGAGQMIPGFDKAVEGMTEGESKTITLSPAEGYGEADERLINVIHRSQFPEGTNPELGQTLLATSPQGQQVRVVVTEVAEETITLDANHPMAGKELVFDIELVEIQ